MAMFSKDLGIDLGTMFTRLADGTQVLLEEPTIVAIEVYDQKMVAVGQEARDMYGRVPESIEVARPLRTGSSPTTKSPKPCFPIYSSVSADRCASFARAS